MRSQGELETMTHEAWMKEMDAWTVEAQGTEYVD